MQSLKCLRLGRSGSSDRRPASLQPATWRSSLLLIGLLALFCQTFGLSEAVTRVEVAEQSTATHVSGPAALEMEANALAQTITNQIRALSGHAAKSDNKPANVWFDVLLVITCLLILGKIGLKLAEAINRRHDPWAARGPTPVDTAAEERSFSEFAASFASGARAAAATEPIDVCDSPDKELTPPQPVQRKSPLDLFLENSAKRLEAARNLFSDINRTSSEPERQRMLTELREQIQLLRREADMPTARPLWQLTSALDSLLNQLVDRRHNVTPSTLRTVAGAIDLLHALRLRGLDPDLATSPPVRVLVVDDDAISRHAIAFSLKKIFSPPDVAPDGEAALTLAEANAYDIVFLDIQMPGMDGFEVCSRIHGTLPNATTPVVFVTCRSDFDTRAKSMVIGGQDLMAKPFLTFELAVKALTLVLHRRLQIRAGVAAPAPMELKESNATESQKEFELEPAMAGSGP